MADTDNITPVTADTSATDMGDGSSMQALSGGDSQPDTQAQPSASVPAQAAQPSAPAQAPQPPQSKWQAILTGALVGLAGGAGGKNFAQGLAGGANASLAYAQEQKENNWKQQQMDVQKQQMDLEKQRLQIQQQTAADSHQLAQQTMAMNQVNLSILHNQYNLAPKSVQEQLDRADMQAGTQLKAEGVPVVSPEGGLDYNAASQLIQARRSADPSSMLQYVMHSNANGKYDVYQVQNPGKVIDNPVDAIIGYDDNHKPITQHYAPNTITVGQLMNIQTNAAVNYVNKQNDLTEFKKKNAITVGGEIAVAKAKQQMDSSPVYAIDPSGQTVLTTKAAAIQGGMSGIRAVKEGDISKDQHDIKVLSDIQTKSNNVAQAAGAMDSKSWTQAARVAKYLADNPNTTTQNLVRAGVLDGMTPQAKNYAINVMSLRESAMGLQKVLTGSARNSETQLGALMNTLPGFEPDSATVKQKLQAFDQNLGLLAQGLPKNTGVELKGFSGGGQGQSFQKYSSDGKWGWNGTQWVGTGR